MMIGLVHKFQIAQLVMERSLLEVPLIDRIQSQDICKATKVQHSS